MARCQGWWLNLPIIAEFVGGPFCGEIRGLDNFYDQWIFEIDGIIESRGTKRKIVKQHRYYRKYRKFADRDDYWIFLYERIVDRKKKGKKNT